MSHCSTDPGLTRQIITFVKYVCAGNNKKIEIYLDGEIFTTDKKMANRTETKLTVDGTLPLSTASKIQYASLNRNHLANEEILRLIKGNYILA